jgi:hypothetical protein
MSYYDLLLDCLGLAGLIALAALAILLIAAGWGAVL